MSNNSWKNTALVLAGILVGCGARSATSASANSPAAAFAPSPEAPRWQQFCEEAENPEDASRKVRGRGEAGFELVAASTRPNNDVTLCYKRRAP